MSDLLSARAFAKLVGNSNVYISRLVKEGRLPTINGKIPQAEGLIAYEENKKPGYDGNRELNAAKRQQPQIIIQKEELPEPEPIKTGTSAAKSNEQYNKARAYEKTVQAKIKDIELKRLQGELVPIAEVKEDAQKLAALIRQKIISVAPIIAANAEGKTSNQIQRIVEIELNEALKDLQKLGE